MAVTVGQIVLVTFVGKSYGQLIMHQLTYRVSAAVGTTTEIQLQNLLLDDITTVAPGDLIPNYMNCLHTGYTMEQVWAQVIAPTRFRKSVEVVTSITGQGGLGEATNVASALEFQTDLAGRDQVSVKKIGPIPLTDIFISDGKLTEDMIELLDTYAANVRAPILLASGDITLTPVIYHPGKTPNWNDITGHIPKDTVRVNQRRTVGHGK